MSVVDVRPARLPSTPIMFDLYEPLGVLLGCRRAYQRAVEAELHAIGQAEADPTSKEAEANVVFARFVGYLLIELHKRYAVLGERACEALQVSVMSEPREPVTNLHEIVFRVGRWYYERLIRLCTLNPSACCSVSHIL